MPLRLDFVPMVRILIQLLPGWNCSVGVGESR